MVEKPKKAIKGRIKERSGIPPPFSVSTEELYNILKAWVKDDMVVLPKCKREPTEKEKLGTLYSRYHRRSDQHTMDCYALRNIFCEKVAKNDLVIKNGKHMDVRMHTLEVAMTFSWVVKILWRKRLRIWSIALHPHLCKTNSIPFSR